MPAFQGVTKKRRFLHLFLVLTSPSCVSQEEVRADTEGTEGPKLPDDWCVEDKVMPTGQWGDKHFLPALFTSPPGVTWGTDSPTPEALLGVGETWPWGTCTHRVPHQIARLEGQSIFTFVLPQTGVTLLPV